jgi:hypothetical protein
MPKFRIAFTGCKLGAIGVVYPIVAVREGATKEAAVLALYDEYEHITFPQAREIKDEDEEQTK